MTVEPDRTRAVRLAIDDGGAGDLVLIAGKGHEDYQEVAGRRVPYSDVEAAREALADRSGTPGGTA